ncbi:WG repeat-containing protein [bacterium]|nr:WG repeat-containing protein [bacterium]
MRKLIYVISIIGLILGFSGCIATKDVKPLRYDGVYKQISGSDVIYLKFEKDKNKWNSVKYSTENDLEAIQELDVLSKSTTKKEEKLFTNDEKKVRIYGGNERLSWSGAFNKNANGEIQNSFFIKTENNKIKETIDLRVLDNFKIYSFDSEPLSTDIFEDIKIINNRYIVVKKNDRYGILDAQTKKLNVPTIYQWIETDQYDNDMVPFKKDNKYGFFDSNFNVIIPAQYDDIKNIPYKGYFIDGIQPVKLNNHWFIINKYNTNVINSPLDDIGEYSSKKFVPIYNEKKKLYEFMNLDTKKFTGVITYRNSVINNYNILDIGKGQNIILDSNGGILFSQSYDTIFPYTYLHDKTYFIVSSRVNNFNIMKGVIDKDSKIIIPLKYKDITPKYNKNGDIIYFKATINYYNNSLYNTNGDLILPAKFKELDNFNEDKKYILGEIIKNNSAGEPSGYYIFKEGNSEPLFKADYIWKINKDAKYAIFRKNGLYGIMDIDLQIVVEAKYKNITDIKGDLYAVFIKGESTIYKIGDEHKLLEVEGRVNFKDKYITVSNRQEDSIYNYQFKKLNSKDLSSIEVCYKDENAIVFKDEDNKWAVIYKNQIKYLDGDFENVKCGLDNFIIAKLKNKLPKQ